MSGRRPGARRRAAAGPAAVVFDFDGVLLDSTGVKDRAFTALFEAEGTAAAGRILAFHRANGGLSRFEKFRWAYKNVLGRALGPEEEAGLGRRFNELVEDAVVRAGWVPGALEFLEARHAELELGVASGTPHEELRRIVARRGMDGYFRCVLGTPPEKPELLARTLRELGRPPAEVVMVGDARNDYEAAAAVGTRFVGVVPAGVRSPFPAGTRILPDLKGLAGALEAP